MPDLKIGTIEGRESGVVTDVQQLKYQLATAWVNFDGISTPITIRDSFNVSSVTDNGTGDYTVNFEQDMDRDDYAIGLNSTQVNDREKSTGIRSVSAVQIELFNGSSVADDSPKVSFTIFGGKN